MITVAETTYGETMHGEMIYGEMIYGETIYMVRRLKGHGLGDNPVTQDLI
jgi:hypothetical protein